MDDLIKGLLEDFISNSSENGDLTHLTDHISIGFVVDNDDPLQQGRLRVFCPAYNDDPKKLLHLPWCAYVSPVGGVVSQDSYTRGHIQGNSTSQGPIHYGFWGIPDIGAHVLVACINGDSRRRVWLGCLPSHQETHTLANGRYKHSDNNVDGPLTSTGNPIEPTSTKLKEAFNNDISSSEWKTRGADYQVSAVTDRPSPEKSVYVDDDYNTISESEDDAWVKDILGEHGYDWTSYKNLGSFLASKVNSWTTPGFHSITMDDRAFNSRIRIRTTGGNQIILDDTNERIYFSTSGGKSWIEMDAAGNIDLYAERRLSLHAGKDLNLSADESIRLKANKFISMYAGNTTGQTPLNETLQDGEIRIHSSNDMHIKSEANLRFVIDNDMLGKVANNMDVTIDQNMNYEIGGTMYLEALTNINLDSANVDFRVSGKDTTVNDFVDFLDEFVVNHNDLVSKYNSHTHLQQNGNDFGGGVNTATPQPTDSEAPQINDESLAENPNPANDDTKLAPWTNRVPEHEPWPRVLKQDSDDTVNTENTGYENNVDWIDQYDNVDEAGRKPIGKVEGDETIERGPFWRR